MSNAITPEQYLDEIVEVARLVDFREMDKFVELLESAFRNKHSNVWELITRYIKDCVK